MTLFFYISSEFVAILYGEKWMDSVPYLNIIIFSTIPIFLDAFFSQTLLGLGDSKLYMKLNMFKRVFNFINIPIAIFWGLKYYLYSITLLSFVGLIISVYLTSKKIESDKSYYLKQFLMSVFLTFIMSIPFFLSFFTDFGELLIVKILNIFLALFIYIVLLKKIIPDVYNYYFLILGSFLKKV
jgi:O-antigen/teichoic acid export membrane protein